MNIEQAYINGFVKKASEYGFDKNQALAILKEAEVNPVRNYLAGLIRRPIKAMASTLAGGGAVAGGAAGGVIGGIKGLISPGQEVDSETGETVDRDRLKAMLTNGLVGAGVGAGVGTGVGAGAGALIGRDSANLRKTSPKYRQAFNEVIKTLAKASPKW
jgi:hypothetical protein